MKIVNKINFCLIVIFAITILSFRPIKLKYNTKSPRSKKIFIKNNLSDTIKLIYFSFSVSDVFWSSEQIDTCIKKDGTNYICLFDSANLIKENDSIIFFERGNLVTITIPPHSSFLCIGNRNFSRRNEGFDLIMGDMNIIFKSKCYHSIQLIKSIGLESVGKNSLLRIDERILNINDTVRSESYEYKDTYFLKLNSGAIRETDFYHGKLLWQNYYNKGKIDSVFTNNKMIVRKCW